MRITFDPPKQLETLADRQLDFLDAGIVLSGHVLTAEDARKDYGEQRFQTVGFLCRPDGDGDLDAARQRHPCHLDEEVQ